jgi:hypothetical protein
MRVFSRHFANLDPDQQLAVTQRVHSRVMGSPTTVFQQIRASRLPQAALHPAFRRVFRPRGALMRKAFPGIPPKPTDILVKLNVGRVTAALPKEAPQKQISLTKAADVMQSTRLRENAMQEEVVQRTPLRPAFRFTLPGQIIQPHDPLGPRGLDDPVESLEGANYRTALLELQILKPPLPAPTPRPQIDVNTISSTLANALNPKSAILQRVLTLILIPSTFEYLRPQETIVPVMAHPVFADPMYKPLRDLSSELLIPNLNLIPNNTITLLETNPKFIEAYMVGLNHEMARELLWREYPTDQRGSYFRQFWDVSGIVNREAGKDAKTLEEELRDIKPLYMWGRTTLLGSHENRTLPTGGEPGERRLVLVIRGDLLKRYPTAVIFAQQAKWVEDEEDPSVPPRKIRELDEGDPKTTIKEPIFKAEIEPDIHFLGFDLTASMAKGDPKPPETAGDPGNPGWFFVIQERPGEPRFGLDITTDDPPPFPLEEWNKLSWNHFGNPDEIPFIKLNPAEIPAVSGDSPDKNIKWASNAADMAYILYQVPVMVAIHADNMLP